MRLNRRQLLQGGAAAALAASRPARGAGPSGTPRRLILVRAGGGWDPTFCMEPRFSDGIVEGPDVDVDPTIPEDVEEIRSFGGVELMVNDYKRAPVTRFFERWMSR